MHSYTPYGIITSKKFLISAIGGGGLNTNFFQIQSMRDIIVTRKFCINLLITDECVFDYLHTPVGTLKNKRASVYA